MSVVPHGRDLLHGMNNLKQSNNRIYFYCKLQKKNFELEAPCLKTII